MIFQALVKVDTTMMKSKERGHELCEHVMMLEEDSERERFVRIKGTREAFNKVPKKISKRSIWF